MSRLAALSLSLLALGGCAHQPKAAINADVLLGRQLQKQDAELIGQQFRTLLDFEHPQDAVFVTRSVAGNATGHTGSVALRADSRAIVNVSSLLFGSTLPGTWRLIGGYVRGPGGRTSATLLADGRDIARTARDAPAGIDLFIAIDLTAEPCRRALATAKRIEVRFEAAGPFALDDVLLVDNRRTLVNTAAEPRLGWAVSVDGLSLAIAAPSFRTTVPLLAGDSGGWAIEEANAVRVRLRDAHGGVWTILPDGRSIRDGQTATISGGRMSPSPAEVTVDDATGRLDRETPGDADNDGYNERLGAYQIVATGPRVKLRLAPRGDSTEPPVIEVHGLPREANTVTVDGRLIKQTVRLADGTLLVLVPIALAEPVELTVGVSGE